MSTSATEPGAAGSTARNELINAIADLALAARAGTLLRIYQRQWSWTDVRNGIDEVDADRFNATFHEIEGEFDALATVLGSGSGLVAPDWQQVLQFPPGPTMVVLTHNLGTTDLLVDMAAGINPNLPALDQVDLPQQLDDLRAQIRQTTPIVWTNFGLGIVYAYGLVDANRIALGRVDVTDRLPIPWFQALSGELALRVRLWRLG